MTAIVDAVRAVWRRDGAAAREVEAVVAAVRAVGDDPRLAALLQARHPAAPAAIAAFDGFVRVDATTLLLGDVPIPAGLRVEAMPRRLSDPCQGTGAYSLEYSGFLYRYPLRGRRARVVTDASVVAGEPLTGGDVDLHDVLLVLGEVEVESRLAAAIAACDVPPPLAEGLATRMLALLRVSEPGDTGLPRGARLTRAAFVRALGGSIQRAVAAADPAHLPAELSALPELAPADAWARWSDLAPTYADALQPEFLVGVPALTGYAELARHRDPC